jgi:shikimate dehydrogenase
MLGGPSNAIKASLGDVDLFWHLSTISVMLAFMRASVHLESITASPVVRLGLIGSGIARSLTPFLQEQAGAQLGLALRYELFDTPADQGHRLEAQLAALANAGYAGVNVTHPFKELAFGLVKVLDPMVQQVRAINTVRFADGQGFNTDYSGFVRAYRHAFGSQAPGVVLVVGAGGAGRAVAFALVTLGASEVRIVDSDAPKAEQLAASLRSVGAKATAFGLEDLALASRADGLVNCTPLGMYQYPGNPIASELVGTQSWAFDAIYTPLETAFLADARAKGLRIMYGSELMFYQAVDAFEIWTGRQLEEVSLYAIIQAKLASR